MRLKLLRCFSCGIAITIFLLPLCDVRASLNSETGGEDRRGATYSAGFKTMELFDRSRTVFPKYDYFGNPIDRETARPIQICIWYPSIKPADELPMVVSEYNFPYPENEEFIDIISEIQNREIAYLMGMVGGEGLVFEILNDEAGAFRDASFADGEFPLILYALDAGHGICENFGLMEYLAARGYVAATIHSIGTFQRDPGSNAMDLETIVRDLETALSSLQDHPNIDNGRIGIIGYGIGADAALILKMRNYDIAAIVSIDNRARDYDRTALLKSSPFFNPDRVDIPMLQAAAGAGTEMYPELTDSFIFSTRYLIDFLPDSGVCLSNYDLYSAALRSPSGESSPVNEKSYNSLCSYVASFFDAYLKGDDRAEEFWSDDPGSEKTKPDILGIKYIKAEMAPPSEFQFMSIINSHGIDTAVELYRKFRSEYPDHIFFREAVFNITGYRFLQSGRIPEALAVFELNADAYSQSANVWDSYGEACLAAGDYEKALQNYKKALEILPQDTTTPEELKTAIRNGAAGQIQRIEELMDRSPEEEGN